MRRERARLAWQPQRDDQVTRREYSFALRGIPRQTMQGLDRDLALSIAAFDLHDRVEADQRPADIRRMGGDTGLPPTQHGVQSGLAAAGFPPPTRRAVVAGAGDG